MPPAPTTPKGAAGASAALDAFYVKRTAHGTNTPVTPPPVLEADDDDVFSPAGGCAGAFGFADIEQIVRDAVGSTAHSPASNHSLSIFLGTNTPPLPSGATLLHAAPGSGPAVGPGSVHAGGSTTWIASASTAYKPSSSECATAGSVGYAEADALASWPSVTSKPASLNAAPTLRVTPTAAPAALAASAGADSVKHAASSKNSSTHSAPNSGKTSPPTAAAAPVAGAVPTSNAASHYKTKRCRHFDQTGWCPYQHRCVFAHGDREFTRYNMQRSLNSAAADGSGPTTSQLVRDHIERNVRQLIDEYEEAVAEASAKAIAKSTAASVDKNSQSGVSPTHSGSAPSGQRLAPPALMAAQNGMSAAPTQCAPPYHQHQFLPPPPPPPPQQQQQSYAMFGQQPILLSAMPGSPTAAAYAVFPSPPSMNAAAPQSLHGFTAHHRQPATQPQQQILFAMPPGAPAMYQIQHPHPQQQQQQQQIFFVGAPYLQAGATPVAAYSASAAPYPGALMTHFA